MNNNTKARWKALSKKDRKAMQAPRKSTNPKVGNRTQKRQVDKNEL